MFFPGPGWIWGCEPWICADSRNRWLIHYYVAWLTVNRLKCLESTLVGITARAIFRGRRFPRRERSVRRRIQATTMCRSLVFSPVETWGEYSGADSRILQRFRPRLQREKQKFLLLTFTYFIYFFGDRKVFPSPAGSDAFPVYLPCWLREKTFRVAFGELP